VALTEEKKIKGRKRHIVTDTQGHLLAVQVHAANQHDTMSGGDVMEKALTRYPTIEGVCADAGYRGTFARYVSELFCVTVDIVKSLPHAWEVLPKRWIVERTFAWLNGYRRLTKDFELSVQSAEAYVKLAHSMLLVNRLSLL
jgi:putative transposase